MKYTLFFLALTVWAQNFPPSSSPVKRPGCTATVTDNCTPQTVGGVTYGVTGSGGDVLGAASVQSGRVPYGSGTTGTLTSSSKFAYNDTTGVGLIPPLSLGQNGTAAGRINFLGSTSGSFPVEANADATALTFTGNLIITGTLSAGASGAMDLTAIAAPATPAAGIGSVYVDSTSKNLAVKDDAGVVKHGVITKAAVTNQVVSAIADDGTVTTRALAAADLPAMVGDSGSGGTKGAVPAPAAGDAAKVLSGAGTWVANGGSTRVVSAQVSNTDTLTAAGAFATTYTLAANPAQFTTIHIRAFGRMTTTGTATPVGAFQVKFGSVGVCNSVTNPPQNDTGDTNFSWSVDCQVTVATTGSSGTVYGNGYFIKQNTATNSSLVSGMTNAAAVTVNTTTTNVIAIEETLTLVAGQSYTLQQLIVEVN